MSVIEAATAGFKDMADGTVRFFFDVEPRHAGAALELFRARGTPAALAALKTGYAAISEPNPEPIEPKEKPKGGALSKLAGMWCQQPEFLEWVNTLPNGETVDSAGDCAEFVRKTCGVESRSELDHDDLAAELFNAHIRGPFMKYQLARGITL